MDYYFFGVIPRVGLKLVGYIKQHSLVLDRSWTGFLKAQPFLLPCPKVI